MLDDIIDFLKNFKWVFDFKWTEISLLKQWDNLPLSWVLFFENIELEEIKKMVLCDFSFKHVPKDIQTFFLFHKRIADLISSRFDMNDHVSNLNKVNRKKSHEIANITSFLSQHIFDEKERYKSDSGICILDIGSGLGHLSRILARDLQIIFEVSVLAVEGNPDLHHRNNCSENNEKLQYFITEENLNELNNEVNDRFPKINIITGLHCCGILSCIMLKYFATISSADCLLLLSCCYHRMFKNKLNGFPLSRIYQEKYDDGMLDFVTVMFLRLGCQESKEKWLKWSPDDYYHHRYTVAFRCAVEQYMSQSNENISHLKRMKFDRKNIAKFSSFTEFIHSKIIDNIEIKDIQKFIEIINEQNKYCHWYSIILALQVSIQEIVEYFILLDRVFYLQQFPNVKSVELIRLFDSSISPRHIAIFASK